MPNRPPPLGPPRIENLPEAQVDGFSVHSFEDSCVHFHWHFHPEVELNYVREGQGILYAGRAVAPFAAGDICLLGPNLPHAYGSAPCERLGARWTVMHFLPTLWGDVFWQMPRNRRVRELLKTTPRGLVFSGSAIERCAALLKSLETGAGRDAGMSTWMEILECLAASRTYRVLNPDGFSEVPPPSTDPRLREILHWIDENADRDTITQATAARLVRMSPPGFCRFFRRHTGKTFRNYLSEVRVARACSSLTHSDASIAEIAFRSGFGNLSNFNRRFQKIIGRTPSDYRKTSLTDNDPH